MKNKFKKKISLILTLITLISLIGFNRREVKADIPNKPTFNIVDMKVTPETALVGADITISGVIKPEAFETTIPAKEIVLVLDISNSMKDKIGSKLSKLEELRIATIDFIKEMRSVENLKISIVKYANYGDILEADFLNMNDNQLENYINANITTPKDSMEGGTNTGEGLRKALYLLKQGEKKSSKTLVLMTDGLPTYHSLSKKTNSSQNFYLNINDQKPNYIGGTGQPPTNYSYYNKGNINYLSRNYAIEIGKLIKNEGYNAYSIGYGIDKNSNASKTFKYIHESISGNVLEINDTSENIIKNEQNGFFLAGDNAISSVFKSIATEILNSYPVNNIALNISFSEGFNLNIGGNKIEIGNISYSKDESLSSLGKAIYTAKEIPFSFIVKGTKLGLQDINTKLNISYIFNNEALNQDINEQIKVNIESNELPKIGASLVSENNLTLTKGDEFNVKYKLSPQDFEFKDINNATEKDVILLIDNSSLANNNAFNSLKNSTFNKLLNNTTLINLKTSYAVITFSDKAELLSGFTTNITSLNDNVIKNINQNSSKEANLDKAIDLVKTTLNGGRSDATKNIIIMAQDNVTYSKSKIEELENKGYNIIILSLGNGQTTSLTSLKDNKNLAIESESIFITGNDGNNVENTYMAKVAERLISSTKYKSYIFNPEITLSLLNNFEVIKGATAVNGNTVKIVSDKKVVYNNIGNNKYHAEPIEIEFTVKVKGENTGLFNLGTALLRHENLLGNYKEIILETPKVTVKEEVKDLFHGLYSGLSGSEIIIEKSIDENAFKIIGGSTVTFGAKFKTTSDKIKATINIDSKFDITHGEFRVYKLVKGSDKTSLIELKQVDNSIRTNYLDITIDGIDTKNLETEVVIVYKVKLKDESENERFENKINAGRLSEKVNIYTPLGNSNIEDDPMEKLPDLF